MIWLWIVLAVTFTVLLLRGKNIEPHNFVWALIPIDRFGINLMGFTLKPVYIYSIFLIGYSIVTRKFRLKVTPSVFISTVFLLTAFVSATFFRFGSDISTDIKLYAMFFFTIACAAGIASMVKDKDDLRQIKDVIIATAVGYGILFIILCSLDAVGITLPDVKSTRIADISVIRTFRNMSDGTLILAQRLRGFYLDANASSVCFVIGFAAILDDWLKKGFNIRNLLFSAVIAANIVLTSSRTAFAMLVIMIAVTVYRLFFTKLQSKRKIIFLCALLIGAVLVILFLFYNTTALDYVFEVISTRYFNRASLNDDSGRLTIWKNALSAISSKNWYCGLGTDGVSKLNSGIDSHNTFIEAICSNGVPFGIFYALFFLYPFVFALRKKSVDAETGAAVSNFMIIYLCIIILSTTVSHISSVYLIYTAFLLFSIPICIANKQPSDIIG